MASSGKAPRPPHQGIATVNPLDVIAKSVVNGTATANAIMSTAATTTANGDLIFGAAMEAGGSLSGPDGRFQAPISRTQPREFPKENCRRGRNRLEVAPPPAAWPPELSGSARHERAPTGDVESAISLFCSGVPCSRCSAGERPAFYSSSFPPASSRRLLVGHSLRPIRLPPSTTR